MNVTFYEFDGAGSMTVTTDGNAVVLTYEHLWDRSGREPVLIGHFDREIDKWVDALNGNLWTDVVISEET